MSRDQGLIPVVQMMPWARACEPGTTELWQSIVAPEVPAVVEDCVAINTVNPGIHFAWHGVAPSVLGLRLQQMFSIVTQGSADGIEICYPPAWGNFPTISVEDAIRMTTINAAAAMGFEADFGTIEVGKSADLVILQDDPFDADAETGRGESGGTEGPLMFGSIDEFAYFARALTPSEIGAIAEAVAAFGLSMTKTRTPTICSRSGSAK